MKSKWMSVAALVGATCGALQADSIPYSHPGMIAPEQQFRAAASGDVSAYFYGTGALFTEELGLFVNGVQLGGWGLPDHSSSVGQKVDFGPVQAGETLLFALKVNDTHYTLYSDGGLNLDGINHTYATPYTVDAQADPFIPSGIYIGFEDSLRSFSDLNYTDEQFVVTNVAAVTTPEPGTGTLLAGSLVALATATLLRKKR